MNKKLVAIILLLGEAQSMMYKGNHNEALLRVMHAELLTRAALDPTDPEWTEVLKPLIESYPDI